MSEGDPTTPAPRRRPTYGLPGSPSSAQQQPTGLPSPDPHEPRTGPLPASVHQGGPQGGPYGGPDGTGHEPAPRRRRGLLPLIIGLVLLLVIAPVSVIGGLVWTATSLTDDVASGPTLMEGGTAEVEVPRNQMLIVYVPEADAESATCTAEGSTPDSVTTVPSSTSVTFGDGSAYVQTLGVVALDDTTVTLSCTGTDAAGYLGPLSALGMAAPLLIGGIVSVVAGLIGLVLTIIGIVLLVRSRRP